MNVGARTLWWAALLWATSSAIQTASAQTMQQLKTCQSLTVDADVKIRACTVFLETGRQYNGTPLIRRARFGITLLRAVGYINKKDYDRASADLRDAIRLDPSAVIAKQTLQAIELTKQMDSRWESYLLEIQNDHDFANWSGPPLEIYRNAK